MSTNKNKTSGHSCVGGDQSVDEPLDGGPSTALADQLRIHDDSKTRLHQSQLQPVVRLWRLEENPTSVAQSSRSSVVLLPRRRHPTDTCDSHVASHPEVQGKVDKYTCGRCQKILSTKTDLKRHERTHTAIKVHDCEFCQMCFTKRSYLTRHMRTHTGEKPFTCTICNKSFAASTALTTHSRIHTSVCIKLYICDLCPKSFPSRGSLKVHRRTHTGEKKYSCSFCEKAYVAPHGLQFKGISGCTLERNYLPVCHAISGFTPATSIPGTKADITWMGK